MMTASASNPPFLPCSSSLERWMRTPPVLVFVLLLFRLIALKLLVAERADNVLKGESTATREQQSDSTVFLLTMNRAIYSTEQAVTKDASVWKCCVQTDIPGCTNNNRHSYLQAGITYLIKGIN